MGGGGGGPGVSPVTNLKLGCKILHSGHFRHCVKKSGLAKAGPAGPAATPLADHAAEKVSSSRLTDLRP